MADKIKRHRCIRLAHTAFKAIFCYHVTSSCHSPAHGRPMRHFDDSWTRFKERSYVESSSIWIWWVGVMCNVCKVQCAKLCVQRCLRGFVIIFRGCKQEEQERGSGAVGRGVHQSSEGLSGQARLLSRTVSALWHDRDYHELHQRFWFSHLYMCCRFSR